MLHSAVEGKTSSPTSFIGSLKGGCFWVIGSTKLSLAEARAPYEKLCSAWNEGEGWDMEGFWNSEAYRQKIALIGALQGKGFRLNPELAN